MSADLRQAAREMFAEVLRDIDVEQAVRNHVVRRGDSLLLSGRELALADFNRVVVIAMGKAAVAMHRAAREALVGPPTSAIVVAPPETLPIHASLPDDQTLYLPGDHPLPTQRSLDAAAAILQALDRVDGRTGVLFLISGGASAMVEQPLSPSISLNDMRSFTLALVGSGLPITAMNALRKHLSAVKGGRLAQAASGAAWQCSLLLSDVPHAAPDAIASGPSLPDSSTIADCRTALLQADLHNALPASVDEWFASDHLPESAKPGDAAFHRSHWQVILSSDHLAQAAMKAAEARGFHAVIDNTCDDWDYREAGRYLLERAQDLAETARTTVCLISVGEIGVTLPAEAGTGGRNQQFAAWCSTYAAERGWSVTILSAGSDGIDGHSHAAGAVCDETTLERALDHGWSCDAALQQFHTTPMLTATEDALVTGPTGNNLRDLRLLLVRPATK